MVLEMLCPVVAVGRQQRKAEQEAERTVQRTAAERRVVEALVLQLHHVRVDQGEQNDARGGAEPAVHEDERRAGTGDEYRCGNLENKSVFVAP